MSLPLDGMCQMLTPSIGRTACPDYDLCEDCINQDGVHDRDHKFLEMDEPGDSSNLYDRVRSYPSSKLSDALILPLRR